MKEFNQEFEDGIFANLPPRELMTIEAYDESRKSFMQSTVEYVSRPTSKRWDNLVIHAQYMSEMAELSLAYFMSQDSSNQTDEQLSDLVSNFLLLEDGMRSSGLNEILPEASFRAIIEDKEMVIAFLDAVKNFFDAVEDEDVRLQYMNNHYGRMLELDLAKLQQVAQNTKQAKALEAMRKLGRKTADFVLISGAVAVGTVLGNKFSNK